MVDATDVPVTRPAERTVALEYLSFVATHCLRGALSAADIQAKAEVHAIDSLNQDAIVMKFVAHILSEPVESRSYQWPRDWQEAFKERWAPRWVLARWPVRYQRVGWTAKALAEKVTIPASMGSRLIHVLESSGVDDGCSQ